MGFHRLLPVFLWGSRKMSNHLRRALGGVGRQNLPFCDVFFPGVRVCLGRGKGTQGTPQPQFKLLLIWLLGKVEDYIDWDVLLASLSAVCFHTTVPFEVDAWSKTTKNPWSRWGCCICNLYDVCMGMLHMKYQKVFKITVGDHICHSHVILIDGKEVDIAYYISIRKQIHVIIW